MKSVIINSNKIIADCNDGVRLIDFLRSDLLGLVGTKEGCGEGECGACTVLIGELNKDNKIRYRACAACLMLVGEMNNKHVVTIEGVSKKKSTGEPAPNLIQKVMIDNFATQCGFCAPGFIMSIIGYLLKTKNFSFKTMIDALDGNICRCTGYVSIKRALKNLFDILRVDFVDSDIDNRVEYLVKKEVLPEYFLDTNKKLISLKEKELSIDEKHLSQNEILVAGGTDVCIQKSDILPDTEKISFISNRSDITDSISICDSYIVVGAATKVEDFRTSEIVNKYFPSINNDLLFFASTILRNNATLAGNLVNASPIGDLSTILLALNAVIIVKKKDCNGCCCENKENRSIDIKDFFKDYKVIDLKNDEIIIEIKIPIDNDKNCSFNFEKVSTRKYLDIASCSSAIFIQMDGNLIVGISISAGGVASIPIRLSSLENFLNGKNICGGLIDNGLEIIDREINPRGSILRGSGEYKKELLKQLIKIHFNKLFSKNF